MASVPPNPAATPGDRDDLGYVFVMTYGRSGSTLVQGLLNAIPGYLIRGENAAALNHLHGFHKTMLAESGAATSSTAARSPTPSTASRTSRPSARCATPGGWCSTPCCARSPRPG